MRSPVTLQPAPAGPCSELSKQLLFRPRRFRPCAPLGPVNLVQHEVCVEAIVDRPSAFDGPPRLGQARLHDQAPEKPIQALGDTEGYALFPASPVGAPENRSAKKLA